jgi:hypothetical protein
MNANHSGARPDSVALSQKRNCLKDFFMFEAKDPKLTFLCIGKCFDAFFAPIALRSLFFKEAVFYQLSATIRTCMQTCLSTATDYLTVESARFGQTAWLFDSKPRC